MSNGNFNVPFPENEPILEYLPGSPEREELTSRLDQLSGRLIEIPARINGSRTCPRE